MVGDRVIYEVPVDSFKKEYRKHVLISFGLVAILIFLWILVILTFISGDAYFGVTLIVLVMTLGFLPIIYMYELKETLMGKRLIIYEDSLVPHFQPKRNFFKNGDRVYFDDIDGLGYYENELDRTIYELNILHKNGKKYSIDGIYLKSYLENEEEAEHVRELVVGIKDRLKQQIPVDENTIYTPLFLYTWETEPSKLEWKRVLWSYERLMMNMTLENTSEELMDAWKTGTYPDEDVPEVKGLIRAIDDACKAASIEYNIEPGYKGLRTKDSAFGYFQPWLFHMPFDPTRFELLLTPGNFQLALFDSKNENETAVLATFKHALLDTTREWLRRGNR